MSLEWVVTGIILLGGMTAAGISLYIKKRREAQSGLSDTEISSDLDEPEKDESQSRI